MKSNTLHSKIGEILDEAQQGIPDYDKRRKYTSQILALVKEELAGEIEKMPIFGYLSSGHIGNEPLPVIAKEQVQSLLTDTLNQDERK